MGQRIIKVANIIEEGRLGGPQIRIAEVARRLKAHGIETTVVYPKYQSDLFRQKLDAYGIKNIRLPLHRLTKDKKYLLAYFFSFFTRLFISFFFSKGNSLTSYIAAVVPGNLRE